MANDSQNSDNRYWRDKYLDLVGAHNDLTAQSEKQREQLRRALVVTSLLGEGRSSQIDQRLQQLRDALKTQSPQLPEILQNLDGAVDSFELQQANQTALVLAQLNEISNKLAKCPLPTPLLKRIKALRQRANTDLTTWHGYNEQLQSWLNLLGDLATLEGYDQEQTSKWWQRWFKTSSAASASASEPVAQDEPILPQISLAAPADASAGNASAAESNLDQIAHEMADALQELLAQLVIPERLDYQLQSLQQRLSNSLQWFEIVPLLEDTTQFLLQCLESSQIKIEQFLYSLDQRLQAIRNLVSEAMNGSQERTQARNQLDQVVREQILDIRSLVTGKSDLQDLGLSVRDHLLLIIEAMEKYKNEEEQREQRLTGQLQHLQQRIDDMEQEVESCRQAFEEQRRKATHDSLTGLPNREAYQERLTDELARHQRYGSPLAMIVCDIDHFKRINDTYGHLAGDRVLQLIGRMLRKHIRDVDFVARYGGEEFVILMPETTAPDAFKAAEKLRALIEQTPFNFRKERVSITLSFGVSEFRDKDAPEMVFERADKALYQSKNAGRNHCTLN